MNEQYYDDVLLWKYIDHWPKIPDEIIEDAFRQPEDHQLLFANALGGRVVTQGSKQMMNILYRRWVSAPLLTEWMLNLYPFDQTSVQLCRTVEDRNRLFPHTDMIERRWAILYVHETGGENVETFFYKEHNQPVVRRGQRVMGNNLDQLDVIGRVVIEPHRWILLNGLVLHDVYPIIGDRKSVVAGITQESLDFLSKK